jgi:hypothetical protein
LSFQLARFEHKKQRWILRIHNCTLFFVHVSPRKLYHILQRRKSVRELLVFFFMATNKKKLNPSGAVFIHVTCNKRKRQQILLKLYL